MRKLFLFFTVSVVIACSSSPNEDLSEGRSSDVNKEEKKDEVNKLIFEDNFDGNERIPDATKWSLCPRRDPAWARYLSESYDQAYVENGNLVLIAEKKGDTYFTGGIHTKEHFSFTYGRVDVRARFTKMAKGGWPAIWMMPIQARYPNTSWPDGGEIDIMEQLNRDSYVWQTIHSHYKNTLRNNIPQPTVTVPYVVGDYNVYSVEWTKDAIVFLVNDKVTLTYPNLNLADEANKKQWPFDRPFYIILNHALGGVNTWPGLITDSDLPAKFEIDYVRVYSR